MNKYNLKEIEEKLNRCRNMRLEDVTLDDVDEISSIKIDIRKPNDERILDFIIKIKSPYIFKTNSKIVRIRFFENGPTAEECLSRMLENLYR